MKLYPPYIEGTLPAFEANGKIRVPYSMNPTVGVNEVKGMRAMVKNMQTNETIAILDGEYDPTKDYVDFDFKGLQKTKTLTYHAFINSAYRSSLTDSQGAFAYKAVETFNYKLQMVNGYNEYTLKNLQNNTQTKVILKKDYAIGAKLTDDYSLVDITQSSHIEKYAYKLIAHATESYGQGIQIVTSNKILYLSKEEHQQCKLIPFQEETATRKGFWSCGENGEYPVYEDKDDIWLEGYSQGTFPIHEELDDHTSYFWQYAPSLDPTNNTNVGFWLIVDKNNTKNYISNSKFTINTLLSATYTPMETSLSSLAVYKVVSSFEATNEESVYAYKLIAKAAKNNGEGVVKELSKIIIYLSEEEHNQCTTLSFQSGTGVKSFWSFTETGQYKVFEDTDKQWNGGYSNGLFPSSDSMFGERALYFWQYYPSANKLNSSLWEQMYMSDQVINNFLQVKPNYSYTAYPMARIEHPGPNNKGGVYEDVKTGGSEEGMNHQLRQYSLREIIETDHPDLHVKYWYTTEPYDRYKQAGRQYDYTGHCLVKSSNGQKYQISVSKPKIFHLQLEEQTEWLWCKRSNDTTNLFSDLDNNAFTLDLTQTYNFPLVGSKFKLKGKTYTIKDLYGCMGLAKYEIIHSDGEKPWSSWVYLPNFDLNNRYISLENELLPEGEVSDFQLKFISTIGEYQNSYYFLEWSNKPYQPQNYGLDKEILLFEEEEVYTEQPVSEAILKESKKLESYYKTPEDIFKNQDICYRWHKMVRQPMAGFYPDWIEEEKRKRILFSYPIILNSDQLMAIEAAQGHSDTFYTNVAPQLLYTTSLLKEKSGGAQTIKHFPIKYEVGTYLDKDYQVTTEKSKRAWMVNSTPKLFETLVDINYSFKDTANRLTSKYAYPVNQPVFIENELLKPCHPTQAQFIISDMQAVQWNEHNNLKHEIEEEYTIPIENMVLNTKGSSERFPGLTYYEWSKVKGDVRTLTITYPAMVANGGQYYKLQLAYVSNDDEVGYWSTVGLTKCVNSTHISIDGMDTGKVNTYSNHYIGNFHTNDASSKIDTYCFNIYDNENNLWATSGVLIHNNQENVANQSASGFKYQYSDTWDIYKELPHGKIFTIEYQVTTVDKITKTSPKYQIKHREYIAPTIEMALSAKNNYEEGSIELSFINTTDNSKVIEASTNALFKITRASSKDNFSTFVPITEIQLIAEAPEIWKYKDYSVEQGVKYQYAWQQFNLYGVYSNKQLSNYVIADFEDMFIYDGKRQLKLRFNPKVSSFKTTLLEQKTDTIGSKYPFIFRNGRVNYKEIPYSGLISYLSDDNEAFAKYEEYGRRSYDYNRLQTPSGLINNQNFDYPIKDGTVTDLVSENIMNERRFKLLVLDWLNDGNPKLLRTPTEGNYMVRLMNNSLAPEETLGRMLHTVSGTAYEIATTDYEDLIKYKIIDPIRIVYTQFSWKTISYQDALDLSEGRQDLYFIEENAYTFKAENFMPGTIFYYQTLDGIIGQFMIGTSGNYEISTEIPINKLWIKKSQEKTWPMFAQVTYSYLDAFGTNFDLITAANTEDIVGRTYFYDGTFDLDKDKMFDVVDKINIIIADKYQSAIIYHYAELVEIKRLRFYKDEMATTEGLIEYYKTQKDAGKNNDQIEKALQRLYAEREENNLDNYYKIEFVYDGDTSHNHFIDISETGEFILTGNSYMFDKIRVGRGVMVDIGYTVALKQYNTTTAKLNINRLDSIRLATGG